MCVGHNILTRNIVICFVYVVKVDNSSSCQLTVITPCALVKWDADEKKIKNTHASKLHAYINNSNLQKKKKNPNFCFFLEPTKIKIMLIFAKFKDLLTKIKGNNHRAGRCDGKLAKKKQKKHMAVNYMYLLTLRIWNFEKKTTTFFCFGTEKKSKLCQFLRNFNIFWRNLRVKSPCTPVQWEADERKTKKTYGS